MTAFGRGSCDFEFGRITVDVQSVNRRFLEINLSLPRLFHIFEIELRKQIASSVHRGMVNVTVGLRMDSQSPVSISPNFALARALKGAWEKLAEELWLPAEMPLVLLTQEKDLFLHEETMLDESVYLAALSQAVSAALNALLSMKRQEGSALALDLKERIHILRQEIDWIESNATSATEKYRQKLASKLEELFSGSSEHEEKVLREVAIFAEKVDITEEITRFRSHLEQMVQTIDKPSESSGDSRGKMLDFLLQELLRESNTMSSKATDKDIAQRVIIIKSELEKMREQVQNIE